MKDFKKGHRLRMMEKYLNNSNCSTKDILEIILYLCIPRKDTKEIANLLLEKFHNSIFHICSASSEELMEIEGLGQNSIVFLKLIKDIALRFTLERLEKKSVLKSFNDLVEYCRLNIGGKKQEEFHVIFLDAKNQIIKDEIIFFGTLSSVKIYPREIIKKCLDYCASKIIFVHNHPSGDSTPSSEDITVTKNLFQVLSMVNISLYDHIIVGSTSFISFLQNKIPPFNN